MVRLNTFCQFCQLHLCIIEVWVFGLASVEPMTRAGKSSLFHCLAGLYHPAGLKFLVVRLAPQAIEHIHFPGTDRQDQTATEAFGER